MSFDLRCLLCSDVLYGEFCRLYGRQQALSLVNLVAVLFFPSCVMSVTKWEESIELLFLLCGPFRFHRFYEQRKSLVNVFSLVANAVCC